MKSSYLCALIALSALQSAYVHAEKMSTHSQETHVSSWADKPSAYFGVGFYDQDFDDIQLSNYTINTDNAFGLSIGYARHWKPNVDVDWSVNLNYSTGDTVDTGLCSTEDNDVVSCRIKAKNLVISMPVVINFRKDLDANFALYGGLGGALNYISRGAEARASGYQSDTIDDEKSITLSPYIQAGLMIYRVRINVARNIALGDDDVGDGDVSSLSLEYFF